MYWMANPGDTIRRWMAARGWSEGELSRRSGVPQPTVHRIITGESKSPRREKVERIARAFGRTIEDAYDSRSKPEARSIDERADEVYESLSFLTPDQRALVLGTVAEFVKKR